jgi:hypothetical protein
MICAQNEEASGHRKLQNGIPFKVGDKTWVNRKAFEDAGRVQLTNEEGGRRTARR